LQTRKTGAGQPIEKKITQTIGLPPSQQIGNELWSFPKRHITKKERKRSQGGSEKGLLPNIPKKPGRQRGFAEPYSSGKGTP